MESITEEQILCPSCNEMIGANNFKMHELRCKRLQKQQQLIQKQKQHKPSATLTTYVEDYTTKDISEIQKKFNLSFSDIETLKRSEFIKMLKLNMGTL